METYNRKIKLYNRRGTMEVELTDTLYYKYVENAEAESRRKYSGTNGLTAEQWAKQQIFTRAGQIVEARRVPVYQPISDEKIRQEWRDHQAALAILNSGWAKPMEMIARYEGRLGLVCPESVIAAGDAAKRHAGEPTPEFIESTKKWDRESYEFSIRCLEMETPEFIVREIIPA